MFEQIGTIQSTVNKTNDMELHHARAWSQSTTASCSPVSSPVAANFAPTKCTLAPRLLQQPHKVLSPNLKIVQHGKGAISSPAKGRKKRATDHHTNKSSQGIRPKANTRLKTITGAHPPVASKTPAFGIRKAARRAELFKSPGGSDYIITPGRHKISMTEFLAGFDAVAAEKNPPAFRSFANYAQRMHLEWLEREKKIHSDVFMLSFCDDCPMEHFRQMAVQSVFNYAVEHQLHEKTVHLAIMNISRLIHARVMRSKETVLTHDLFACTVMAALRNAIKNDESYEKADKFRLDPEHVWRSSPFLANVCLDHSASRMNQVESECLKLLEEPSNPPLGPEFFERYLEIGGWPKHQNDYKELGSFLMGLGLFSSGSSNPLRRTPGSHFAAAALVLAVKVINTDNATDKYEFWPGRLQAYTGLTLEALKPAIRGLASLLRNKPKHSGVLEKYYSKWSEYDWN